MQAVFFFIGHFFLSSSFFNTDEKSALSLSLSTALSHKLSGFFMQDPKNPQSRKPWYQRAIEMTTLWKALAKPTTTTTTTTSTQEKNLTIWKTISTTNYSSHKQQQQQHHQQKLRKCTSLKVASSLTRVCLCAPISSYNEIFQADVPPRRSNSYPRSKPLPTHHNHHERTPSGRISMEGRRIFRGKSLTDDVLMRRFVIEEEAMMQHRRRNEMEIIRKRSAIRRRKLGPSPLRKMVLANDQEEME